MMRSLFSGVSGLRVHQTKMDVIANNISNVNTNGYKSSRVTFNEVFNQTISGASAANDDIERGGTNPMQIGLGAGVSSIDKIMTTGAAQRTDNPYDLMIQGDGFFVVGDANGTYFTRAGALNIDADGYLVTATGLKVMGWDADVAGKNIIEGVVKPIEITGSKEYVVPNTTTQVDYSGNLNATKNNGEKTTTMTIYDSVGNYYVVDTKLVYDEASKAWDYRIGDYAYLNGVRTDAFELEWANAGTGTGTAINIVGPAAIISATNFTSTGQFVTFDSNGMISGPAADPNAAGGGTNDYQIKLSLTVNPTSGLKPDAYIGALDALPTPGASVTGHVTVDFSDLTQFGNESSNATAIAIDGNKPGTLNGVSVGSDGIIVGRYSNGQTKQLGQIPIAQFSNPSGLEKIGNNLFAITANSGDFDGVGMAVQSGGGSMLGGVLEMSNVDLSSEFTEMITTQRGFQANSRIITTSDDMLQELVNLKR